MFSSQYFKSYSFIPLVLYGLSGLTALAYEVLWVRMLALQFGVSIFGVVVTVSAFMAGLGIGSVTGLGWARRAVEPLRWFAIFEFSVAVLALTTPWLLLSVEDGFAALAGQTSLVAWYFVQFTLVGVLLFIPAFCMGAAFPMMLKALGDSPLTLSKAYGVNTLGAALGALAPLLLLPMMGWLPAMQSVAVTGIFIAAAAALFSIRLKKNALIQSTPKVDSVPNTLTLVAYGGIGAAALMLEVAWTRLFGMVLLRTEYVLAIILAIYLIGVGLGSLAARFMRQGIWYTVLPVAVSLYTIAGLWMVPQVVTWLDYDFVNSMGAVVAQQIAVLIALTLPVTVMLGAWLPLLNKLFGANHISGAWLYGSNSVGASVGALLAGFVLTPLVGSATTIVVAALLLLILGLMWNRIRYAWICVPIMVLVAYPVSRMPSPAQLLPNLYGDTRQLYSYEDAVNITHVIERPGGQRLLLADLQRMDAASDPASVEVQKNQSRLPLLLHPQPQSVLFLGLGTGISAAGSLAYPHLRRTAVELSQGAIDAAQHWFVKVNSGVVAQLNVVRDDARRFLMANEEHYDVIIGDLFHPDLVGRSALLSVQQFARAKQRLSEHGVFVQWLALNQFTVDAFEIVARSFQKEFPHAVIFVDAFRVALVGTKDDQKTPSGDKRPFVLTALNNMGRLTEEQRRAVTGGEGVWTWLGRYWGPLSMGEGIVQDEWIPRIEFDLPRARYSGQLDLALMLNYLLQRRPSVQAAQEQLQVAPENRMRFESAYKATELAHKSWLAFLTGHADKAEKMLQLAYRSNPADRWIGFAIADGALASLDTSDSQQYNEIQVLESILKVRPDHPEALLRLWHLAQAQGDGEKAAEYRARFQRVDPLSSALKKAE